MTISNCFYPWLYGMPIGLMIKEVAIGHGQLSINSGFTGGCDGLHHGKLVVDETCYSAEEILDYREKRSELQQQLTEKYKATLVVARVNYPGINKMNVITVEIMDIIKSELLKLFGEKVKKEIFSKNTPEGPIEMLVVHMKAYEVKRVLVEFEEMHSLGRCVDLDVFDENGESIGRSALGLPMRKCFLCGEIAHACVRSRKHEVEDLKQFISQCLEKAKQEK